MNKQQIILETADYVKHELADAEKSHDWWHIQRVWNNAGHIQKYEGGDLFVVELGALLHDIADTKFHEDEELGPMKARDFLSQHDLSQEIIEHIQNIIRHISFSKSLQEGEKFNSLELRILQDADKLDAIGAIGIARAFNFGGHKNREIYNPEISPEKEMTKEKYEKRVGTTINHFYEKLLKLKGMMNTETGRQMAEQRHAFMEQYLDQFYLEWNGER